MTDNQRAYRRDPLLWVFVIAAATLYGGLSISTYRGYNAGMLDLGNMAQAVWTTLNGRMLELTQSTGNVSRLAGHVEAIYFFAVPLYALWEDPRLLLALQAIVMAMGAVPVYAIAWRRLNSRTAARALTLAYLLYPTAVFAVLFDLHGDTLAMPLLLFALDALDRAAWRSYALFIILSLLCKFYIAAPVALLGLTLLNPARSPYPASARLASWQVKSWTISKVGLLTLLAACVYGTVTFFVIRPLFATTSDHITSSSTGYISYYFGIPTHLPARIISVAAVLLPCGLLSFWALRTLFPSLAIIVPAALSTGPAASYDFRYHHYAAAVPFIIVAAIIGAAQRRAARRDRPVEVSAVLALTITLIFHIAFNDTPLGMTFWRAQPGAGMDSSRYGRTARDALKDQWLAKYVPPDIPIAASNFIAPHLTNRETLYLLRYPNERHPDALRRNIDTVQLVVADALFDYYVSLPGGYGGGVNGEAEAIALVLNNKDFTLVEERDGLLLFERGAEPEAALVQEVDQTLRPPAPQQRAALRFGDAIELTGYGIEHLGGRRYQLQLHWRALRPFLPGERYLAVSRLHGPGELPLRYPHLPTQALLPTDKWSMGTTIVETRTIALPDDTPHGMYRWSIGWYNPAHPRAAWSEPEALLRGSTEVMLDELVASGP